MPDEKAARAIYEARGAHEPPRAWRKWEGIGDEARAVWCQCATAALSAAHAEPVATEAAIRADEREKCAKVADQTQREADAMLAAERDRYQQAYFNGQIFAAEEIATAIRAREDLAPNAKRPDPA